MAGDLDAHYKLVVQAIVEGRIIFFLGSGANRCDRPLGTSWKRGEYLPDGTELAIYLANISNYTLENRDDLAHVSQYVAVMEGTGPLYKRLHPILNGPYALPSLHRFLATLPATLRAKNFPHPNILVVTANYDDLLERAFGETNEPYDLVTYIADGDNRGKFFHCPPNASPVIIDKPNEYVGLSLEQHSQILKIHGAIDHRDAEMDSYVISEDHYIDYLARSDISNLLPVTMSATLRKSSFLFLGYRLRDWNMRVILRRIWSDRKHTYKSWAIQLDASEFDRESWKQHNVEIFNANLADYTSGLGAQVRTLPAYSENTL